MLQDKVTVRVQPAREKPALRSLIDAGLVLLCLYLVVAVLSREMPGRPAPAATSSVSLSQVVMELSGGRVVLNGQPVPRKELEALLRSIFAGRPSGVLFLLVAPGANRREASILIGVAKRSGVHRVALVPAATGQPVAH